MNILRRLFGFAEYTDEHGHYCLHYPKGWLPTPNAVGVEISPPDATRVSAQIGASDGVVSSPSLILTRNPGPLTGAEAQQALSTGLSRLIPVLMPGANYLDDQPIKLASGHHGVEGRYRVIIRGLPWEGVCALVPSSGWMFTVGSMVIANESARFATVLAHCVRSLRIM